MAHFQGDKFSRRHTTFIDGTEGFLRGIERLDCVKKISAQVISSRRKSSPSKRLKIFMNFRDRRLLVVAKVNGNSQEIGIHINAKSYEGFIDAVLAIEQVAKQFFKRIDYEEHVSPHHK